ncbi:tetratricopeptide repeat protein [Leptolyngbyaceae cyanobacterium UHCC 1019]
MAKDRAGWIGTIVGVVALGFAAQQYFFGTFAKTQIDDIKGCNGFLIKEKPVALSTKAIPEAIEQKYLQDKILSCRDELQKNDKNAVAYTNIGEATRRLGDLPTALIAQQEAVKLDPNLQEAKLGLGLVQADMGKTAEANQTIQDTLAQKESAIAYLYQGIAFGKQKDWRNAETSFRKATDLNPNNASTYYGLGIALDKQGNLEGAIAAYQKAISINPNLVEAYNSLGIALQKAISINPNNANTYYNLGIALDKQGNLEGAIAKFKRARDLYRTQGNTQQAEKITQLLEKAGIR